MTEQPATSRTETPMADGYQTREQVAAKVDWEGGIPEALEYGLTVDDMPAGDEELRAAWGRPEAAHQPFAAAEAEAARLLEEALGEPAEPGPPAPASGRHRPTACAEPTPDAAPTSPPPTRPHGSPPPTGRSGA